MIVFCSRYTNKSIHFTILLTGNNTICVMLDLNVSAN